MKTGLVHVSALLLSAARRIVDRIWMERPLLKVSLWEKGGYKGGFVHWMEATIGSFARFVMTLDRTDIYARNDQRCGDVSLLDNKRRNAATTKDCLSFHKLKTSSALEGRRRTMSRVLANAGAIGVQLGCYR